VFVTAFVFAKSDSNTSLSPNFWYGNVNLNYFDWTKKAEDEGAKGDYSYFGFEGGAGWDRVEAYGFLNIENPLHRYDDATPQDLRFTAFCDVDTEIANNFKLHFQDYAFNSNSYYVNDFVLGFGYKFTTDFGLWFRPFLALHHTYDTYYKGLNGYMTGWLFNYDFKISKYKFTIFQWNEIEFDRKKSFYLSDTGVPVGDGASWGVNGALSFWFHVNKPFTVGVQYRYAKNKLGSQVYKAGTIYTVKYNF
jgi:hypothetical protein